VAARFQNSRNRTKKKVACCMLQREKEKYDLKKDNDRMPPFLTPKLPAYVAVIILIIFNQTGAETRERRWSE